MQSLTSRSSTRQRWMRLAGTGATALLAATAVASAAGAATTPANAPAGATGSVAALIGSTMEVQNPTTGQTSVSWTASTQFSQTVSKTVSSLSAGDCVTVTGTPSKSSKTTIAARSITVGTPNASGSCTGVPTSTGGASIAGGAGPGAGGFRFRTGGGGFGGGAGGTRPSSPRAGGGSFGGFRLSSLAIARGKVTGVNGSTVTVSGIDLTASNFRRPAKTNSSKSKSTKPVKPVLPKTENLKITTSSSTSLSETQAATASTLAVGDCVSAFGPAASNGAITASTVRITSTGGQTCSPGFGGGATFFGGGPGGPGGPGA
jgi:hypothetical protein